MDKGIENISIRKMNAEDISNIFEAFQREGWPKPASIFETYLHEQYEGSRSVWVAYVENRLAGYVTLTTRSLYQPFITEGIPEIMDLNVLPEFRRIGIGAMLMDIAEEEAATQSSIVGIGVGLYGGSDGGYGAAQRLYIKRGYIPDGRGVTYAYEAAEPGHSYSLDDELVLWLTKMSRT